MSSTVSTTLLLHFVDILSSFFLFVTFFWTFSLENATPAQVSPDDSDTDSDGSSKNKKPWKQSKRKSQLEKSIKRLCSVPEDKATALERGHRNSYEEQPDYPVFSNTSKKRTKSASELTQALTEVASVFLKSSRSDVSSHVEQVNVQGIRR